MELDAGDRAPLVMPGHCGTYQVETTFTPWGSPASPYARSSSFEVSQGPGGAACPAGGPGPFAPEFLAGTLANSAATHSPFHLRVQRGDAEQEISRLSVELPPGLTGRLAGVSFCPEAAIEAARQKSGAEELAAPSCPASSRVGATTVGAGTGAALVYVPGKVYLAGPYRGAPLSVLAVTPAKVGPFDLGTVVIRQALRIDPATAEVSIDGAADPLPRIIEGIPVRLRDVRADVDRPDFMLNPTSCAPSAVSATLFGVGLDLLSLSDDTPAPLSSPFQAANCARLGFKPALSLRLIGSTKRGGHPALRGEYRPRPGDANLKSLAIRLPRSAFLDQAHIRTICTRVQFAQEACPAAAAYGRARAFTPLLDQPLEGPVYLRSSDNELPDMVLDLHGLIDIEAAARIDSVRGGIRASFSRTPDAPLSRVIVSMQGGRKGLIQNSTDLCRSAHRARLSFGAHNGALRQLRPPVKARCGKARRAAGRGSARSR